MNFDWQRAAFWCAFLSAGASVCSIAASQTLLGFALAMMLIGRLRWRPPAHWAALAFFAAWTLLALALSDAPRAGFPQVKKFYAWLILFAVATTFTKLQDARRLAILWVAVGTLSALWGLRQFALKWMHAAAAHQDFYATYVSHRITGFMSHWMTFSGHMMLVLLIGAAYLLWGRPERRVRWALLLCLPIVAAALILGFTRGIWLASSAGILYLLWSWKRWTVALLPLAACLVFFAGPAGLRSRVSSLLHPHGELDSNQHRIYTFRTGIEMIKAHPWFGLGPERVGPHFREYVPSDLSPQLPDGYYGHLHNIYTQFAAERGLPAMLALLWFLLANLWDWIRALRRGAGDSAWLLRAAVAAMIGILVTGLFEYNLGDSEVLAMTLAVVSLAGLAARKELAES